MARTKWGSWRGPSCGELERSAGFSHVKERARGPFREVLVVEDNPDLTALIEMLLAGAGYAVRTAGDGAQALLCIAERMPSVHAVRTSACQS